MPADFDKAIDAAVREMLDVEPPADIRARVVAQLTASGSRLPAASGFRLPAAGWVLGSIAAAAIVILAVFVARRGEPLAPQATVVARGADTRLPASMTAPPRVQAAAEPPPSASTVRPAPSAARAAAVVIAAAYAGDDHAAGVTPLNSIAPITVAPIGQESIAPAEIAVRPLDPITDVQIAPLTPPDRRN